MSIGYVLIVELQLLQYPLKLMNTYTIAKIGARADEKKN